MFNTSNRTILLLLFLKNYSLAFRGNALGPFNVLPRQVGHEFRQKVALELFRKSDGDDNKAEQRKSLISSSRRKQLGISDDEEEYDLDVALGANTDPFITKVIAGSAIVAIFALLIVGVIVPSLSDYGEGVCVPITSGGRC